MYCRKESKEIVKVSNQCPDTFEPHAMIVCLHLEMPGTPGTRDWTAHRQRCTQRHDREKRNRKMPIKGFLIIFWYTQRLFLTQLSSEKSNLESDGTSTKTKSQTLSRAWKTLWKSWRKFSRSLEVEDTTEGKKDAAKEAQGIQGLKCPPVEPAW